ncbi:MAG: hypothetical protein IKB67_05100 [Clostridia bacterium]|nr:hypothetical protein [Clostridia bacterium]
MLMNPKNDKFDIIILAGQSNASGCGWGETTMPWEINPKIKMLRGRMSVAFGVDNDYDRSGMKIDCVQEYWVVDADERWDSEEKINQGVLALQFAKAYCENNLQNDRKILIVDNALGGTSFSKGHWAVGDLLYSRLFKITDEALSMNPENKVVAVLWHQGESDVEQMSPQSYKDHILALIENIRTAYGNVPFISGGFVDDWANFCPRSSDYENIYKELVGQVKRYGFASAKGLLSNDQVVGRGGSIHFSKESINLLGKRYYNEYEKILKEKL